MRRDQLVKFRATAQERAALTAAADAAELSLSDWLRVVAWAAIERAPVYGPDERRTLDALAEELRRIGINLNQLVRALHTHDVGGARGRLPEPEDLARLLDVIEATHADLRLRLDR